MIKEDIAIILFYILSFGAIILSLILVAYVLRYAIETFLKPKRCAKSVYSAIAEGRIAKCELHIRSTNDSKAWHPVNRYRFPVTVTFEDENNVIDDIVCKAYALAVTEGTIKAEFFADAREVIVYVSVPSGAAFDFTKLNGTTLNLSAIDTKYDMKKCGCERKCHFKKSANYDVWDAYPVVTRKLKEYCVWVRNAPGSKYLSLIIPSLDRIEFKTTLNRTLYENGKILMPYQLRD